MIACINTIIARIHFVSVMCICFRHINSYLLIFPIYFTHLYINILCVWCWMFILTSIVHFRVSYSNIEYSIVYIWYYMTMWINAHLREVNNSDIGSLEYISTAIHIMFCAHTGLFDVTINRLNLTPSKSTVCIAIGLRWIMDYDYRCTLH